MAFLTKISSFYMILVIWTMAASITEARDHLVGGKADAWNVPSSDPEYLNKWAQHNRFQIRDTLVWKYDNQKDSVMEVRREAYLRCNTSNPIAVAEHKNEETKVVLHKSGPHYFISGIKDNCDKGEKLIVVVLTPRHTRRAGAVSPAVAPAPAFLAQTPAVAPTSGAHAVRAGVLLLLLSFFALLL
ncbi:hypothetical protein vseg_014107 [Gypsophila vaccaria]